MLESFIILVFGQPLPILLDVSADALLKGDWDLFGLFHFYLISVEVKLQYEPLLIF